MLRQDLDYESKIRSLLGTNTIVLADEGISYLKSNEFERVLSGSGFYLIVISRDVLKCFDYSVYDVFEFKSIKRGSVTYTRQEMLYTEDNRISFPKLLIMEDSASGYDIMKRIVSCDVLSAKGKDNIVQVFKGLRLQNCDVCVLVDGAAFGANIEDLMLLKETQQYVDIHIIAPESFEWVLLKTSFFSRYLSNELEETYLYADTVLYKTWENYYTDLLKRLCLEKYSHTTYAKGSWRNLGSLFKSSLMLREVSDYFSMIDDSIKSILQ